MCFHIEWLLYIGIFIFLYIIRMMVLLVMVLLELFLLEHFLSSLLFSILEFLLFLYFFICLFYVEDCGFELFKAQICRALVLVIIRVNIVVHLLLNNIASVHGIDVEVSVRKAGEEAGVFVFEENHLLDFVCSGSHKLFWLRLDILVLVIFDEI